MVGMLLHQDASKHAWLPGDARHYDLVVTLDDATSAIYSAFLVGEEGTASSFRGLAEVIARERPVLCPLHRPRRALFPYPGGRRAGTKRSPRSAGPWEGVRYFV